MTFSKDFDTYVCAGETIETWVDGFFVIARIEHDNCPDGPDERSEGFWPSLYIDAPGFIGPGKQFRQRFAEAQAKAQAIMDAWRADEWFYCGIVLSISRNGVTLDQHAASLWGVEANYPDRDNSYLRDVANDLLPAALARGRSVFTDLCGGSTG